MSPVEGSPTPTKAQKASFDKLPGPGEIACLRLASNEANYVNFSANGDVKMKGMKG